MLMRLLAITTATIFLAAPASGSPRLQVLWSTPISEAQKKPRLPATFLQMSGTGRVFIGESHVSDRSTIFLGELLSDQPAKQFLVIAKGGHTTEVPLLFGTPAPSLLQQLSDNEALQPFDSTLAATSTGDIWVAGFSSAPRINVRQGHTLSVAKSAAARAYVARLTARGEIRWQKAYGSGDDHILSIKLDRVSPPDAPKARRLILESSNRTACDKS